MSRTVAASAPLSPQPPVRWGRRFRPALAPTLRIALLLTCLPITLGAVLLWFGPSPLGTDIEFSPVVLDRHGQLLRAFATPEGRWRLPTNLQSVDPRFVEALLTYEDKRFYAHRGVDVVALMRAGTTLVRRRHIVS